MVARAAALSTGARRTCKCANRGRTPRRRRQGNPAREPVSGPRYDWPMAFDVKNEAAHGDDVESVHEALLWRDNGWTARVVKNEDDDGWAVAMTRQGESEPALVGPWTMGRDKKNPKPLDVAAFNVLVKTASEVLRRAEQHRHAMLNRSVTVSGDDGSVTVALEIVPDEYESYAVLSARDAFGEELASCRVRPDFKLNSASASAWVEDGFRKPR